MPTISDVAKRAGVSPATVSHVLQGAKNVRPDTRAKVERAIEELGYVPSAVAQSLRSKRTRSLALVVSDITNPFWTTVARGVEDVAQSHRYSVLLCNTDENLAKQQQYLDFLIRQQVDGVIIAPYDSDAQHLDQLRKRNIPTVIVDRRIDGWDVDSVQTDSVAGARALVQHLISLGHERIAMLSGPAITLTAKDLIAGYCLALTEAGIPLDPKLIRRGEFRTVSGEELTHQLLDEALAPTAIFAANNAIALGVIDAVARRGLRIPQDIALVCFDDLPNASRLFPFLTVVAQPVYDLGVNAAQLLLSRLDSEANLRPRHVVLPSRLILRHSCGSKLTENGHCPIANLTSFFDSAMLAIGMTDAFYMFYDNRPLVEKLMDILLENQEKVMRAVCDRFADDLALVMVNDDIAYNTGLMIKPAMFLEIFPQRMKRLIAPAKEHGKLALMHTDGKTEAFMDILYEVGIDANYPIEPESNDIAQVKKKWAGRMALIGNIPTVLLAYGRTEEIEERVREYCLNVAPGGYVLGSSTSIMDGIPPENFVTMIQAVHKYGRYGSLLPGSSFLTGAA